MTNLEFINKEIERTKTSCDSFKIDYEFFHRDSDKRDYEKLEEKLYYLQQIKTDLEAWEIVKLKEVDLFDIICSTDYKQYKLENDDLLKQYFLNKKEYETIKKALEVDDAKN